MRAARNRIEGLAQAALLACVLTVLQGCGGGSVSDSGAGTAPAEVATGQTLLGGSSPALSPADATTAVEPAYHLAPVLPGEPDPIDATGLSLSINRPPRLSQIPPQAQGTPTRGLAVSQLLPSAGSPAVAATAAGAAAGIVTTYSPAQIRAAYALPPVPSNLTGLTALQSAQLGAGSTIYVIDAFHDPYAFSELLALSQLFGLPGCTLQTLPIPPVLPLAAPASNVTSCEFYQIASDLSGSVTATVPAYNAQWATEIAMDVQWAHAIAPLARIVLIEAQDATLAGMTGAVQLANAMGPGAVSMSFTGLEGSYVTTLDGNFQTSGMSYFAATGDKGAAVGWPAVSPYVVAVGGTSLSFSGTGTRAETAWSLTGGGTSAYEPAPAYQTGNLPGLGRPAHRVVADVAMNADPLRGQFVATIPNPLTCTFCQVSWITAGGTSLATPEWAGLTAVANALRLQAGKSLLGDPHAALYGQIAAVNANYVSDFADITQGNDGNCTSCTAGRGYDSLTGLGTPNGLALINTLVGSSSPPAAPVVTGATINGAYNQTLSFTASVSDANAPLLSLVGAPSGMSISSNAVVSWGAPTPGTFPVTVVARDSKTGLSGKGVYTIVIAPPPPPRVSSGSISGTSGKPLSFAIAVGDINPCTLTLSGAPAGMTVNSSTGMVSWPAPVTGTWRITVNAHDARTGESAQGVYTVAISVPLAPAVLSGSVTGRPGATLNVAVGVIDANPCTFSLAGAPAGMSIDNNGNLSWPNPVAGSYAVPIYAKDSKTGLTGDGMYTVLIGTATGPAVTASNMNGVAGKPFSGTLTFSDADAGLIGVGLGGGPLGLSFSLIGGSMSNLAVNWPNPVAGSYTLQVSVTDAAGLSAQVTVPLTISAK